MSMANPRKLTADERAALARVAAMPDNEIDLRDRPEVKDWSGAVRGMLYKPVKQQLTLRLDADLVAWFKAHGADERGYQTRINRALREYVSARERERDSS
jgi:uncharacterized protein (DUF4415 family)